MFSVTHFTSEFVNQSQAAILRKVTMTQFMWVIGCTAVGVGLFGAPLWLAPLFIVAGYVAGYNYQGELVWKRLLANLLVTARQLAGTPQIVNVQAEWDAVHLQAEQQQNHHRLPAVVIVE